MNKKDIAQPHRLLINRSLHKETYKLRVHIDEYKERYDEQYQLSIDELEIAQSKLNADLQEAKEAILNDLSAYQDVMEAIGNSIAKYVSIYYDRQILYKRKEGNSVRQKIVEEYIQFLSNQMKEIGIEIELLQERIDLISRKAAIDDILQLIRLSGNALPIENISDAKELLDLVKKQMTVVFDSDRAEWFLLSNLRRLLEERVSFLSEIQYITWVIEQKRQLSKELKGLREIESKKKSELQTQARIIQKDIDEEYIKLWNLAKEIRFYWARPIVKIGAEMESKSEEISSLTLEIKDLSDRRESRWKEIRSVQDDIDSMKSSHSSNSAQWDSLHRKKRGLYEEVQSLKLKQNECYSDKKSLNSDIQGLKSRRTEWNETRKRIQAVMWNHSVPLMRIGSKNQYDDAAYAEIRMQELTEIAAESRKAAEEIYRSELEKIRTEKSIILERKFSAVADQTEKLDAARRELNTAMNAVESKRKAALKAAEDTASIIQDKLNRQKRETAKVADALDAIKAADKRFMVVRWLFDTPEIERAKASLEKENEKQRRLEHKLAQAKKYTLSDYIDQIPDVAEGIRALAEAQGVVAQEEKKLIEIEKNFDAQIDKCDDQMRNLKPKPDRPTDEERLEMQCIQTWHNARQRQKNKQRRN